MTSTSLIVPFRPDGGDRDRAWAFLKARYERLYPAYEIVESDCEGAWAKGRAVRAAVDRSSGDDLIIADADVLMCDDVVPRAVDHLELGPWVVPHGMVYRLNRAATETLLAGGPCPDPTWSTQLAEPLRRRTAGGGYVILPRSTYEQVPIDDRFELWGGEDMSWGWALATLIGPPVYLSRPMWHLYHERAYVRNGQRGSLETEELLAKYQAASGDPEAIARVMEKA